MENSTLKSLIESTTTNSDNDDIESVLDTIFTFYGHFLNEESSEKDSISQDSSSSSVSLASRSEESVELVSKSSDAKAYDSRTDIVATKILFSAIIATANTASVDPPPTQIKRRKKENFVELKTDSDLRLEYLMTVPQRIIEAVNSSNMKLLKTIVEEAFLPDCKLRTNALPSDLVGRDKFLELHASLNRKIPDFLMNILPPSINHRVITAKVFSTGTRLINDDPSDYLYDHLKYTNDKAFQSARDKDKELRDNGKLLAAKTKSLMHLVLNKEFTHVEMINYASKEFNVSESPLSTSVQQKR